MESLLANRGVNGTKCYISNFKITWGFMYGREIMKYHVLTIDLYLSLELRPGRYWDQSQASPRPVEAS